MNSFFNWGCGCGGSEPDEEEIERVVREVEEEREDQPAVIPVSPDENPIEAPFWPTRKPAEVEVE